MSVLIEAPDQHAEALHPADAPGLVTLAVRDHGRWRQIYLPPEELPDATRYLRGRSDWYLTQNRFSGPRSVARLLHLNACWADLDQHGAQLGRVHPWHVRDQALRLLEEASVPAPGLSIATGRGVCLLWRHSAVPRAALPRWRACQRRITEVLRPLGADPLATDAARVLRLIGTVNSHTETLVEAISPLSPAWPFEQLANETLPLARGELHSLRVARAHRAVVGESVRRSVHDWSGATYWETVLSDLQRLRRHRWFGGLPVGQRDAWMVLAAVAVSWLAPPAVLRREVAVLARECAQWDEPEARARLSAVLGRAHRAARGERVSFERQEVDPRYRFKAETMVHWLGITPEEMRAGGLRVLVDGDVRRELAAARQRQSRHARGVNRQSREEYAAELGKEAAARRQAAVNMRAEGLAWAEVGCRLGISARAARVLAGRDGMA